MRRTEIKRASIEELVKRYEELAKARNRVLTAKSSNKAFDEQVAILKELDGREPPAIPQLGVLLNSVDPWVRADSAIPLLFFRPKEAEGVLDQLTRVEPGLLRAETKITLDMWREGKLKRWW